MKYFAYIVVGRTGYDGFDVPQTPQSFADDTEQRLTEPDFLEGYKRYALVVWALPEGVDHVDDVPHDSVALSNYMQCGGSTQAMTVEVRVTQEDGSYEHYVVARKPVADPDAWTTIMYNNTPLQVHPEEVFTGEQAAPVFRAYIEDGVIPPRELLRTLDI
ncbi:NTP pyrophosphohydrolase [Rothia sp. HSID18067]|uniref:NTP pyrophosphohydrolase n=1 Tax=Rothia TaxID=32207 RepID=UPI000F899801|nr:MULTISPECIES: NTP pyrophosphohydrolase [Rothia]RUP72429.1 NTP pyrophosphohydrolase [Rothia sp. HSID18067]